MKDEIKRTAPIEENESMSMILPNQLNYLNESTITDYFNETKLTQIKQNMDNMMKINLNQNVVKESTKESTFNESEMTLEIVDKTNQNLDG